jgi:hypothetical protein
MRREANGQLTQIGAPGSAVRVKYGGQTHAHALWVRIDGHLVDTNAYDLFVAGVDQLGAWLNTGVSSEVGEDADGLWIDDASTNPLVGVDGQGLWVEAPAGVDPPSQPWIDDAAVSSYFGVDGTGAWVDSQAEDVITANETGEYVARKSEVIQWFATLTDRPGAPAVDQIVGVRATNRIYRWDGSAWQSLGGVVGGSGVVSTAPGDPSPDPADFAEGTLWVKRRT